MTNAVLTGADTALGRKTQSLLETGGDGNAAVDIQPLDQLMADDLKQRTDGADVVIHLEVGSPETPVGGTRDVEIARRVLDAASAASVRHVVVVSDATVYGAWANNPVPLTDDAVLRPNPGFAWAAERAEIERLAGEWRASHPGATVSILRPVRTAGHSDWLIRLLRPGRAVPELSDEPPAQFLHVEDLASAVVLATRERLDGVFNAAPDNSIPGEQVRSLTGAGPKVRLPERLAERFASWRFRSGLGATPPELVPYTLHPWVIANDRLRGAGWDPQVSNEEACVEAHTAGPWATLSPRRRQELALGVAGIGIAGAAAGGALALRRFLRRG